MESTLVEYMYRDASNFKFFGEFVVSGSLKRESLACYLFDNEFFVPHEVGLEHLLNMPMNQDDHFLHTFLKFSSTDRDGAICSATEFVERFKSADEKGWFSSFDC